MIRILSMLALTAVVGTCCAGYSGAAPPAITVFDPWPFGTGPAMVNTLWFARDGKTLIMAGADYDVGQVAHYQLKTRSLRYVRLAKARAAVKMWMDFVPTKDGKRLSASGLTGSPGAKDRQCFIGQWNPTTGQIIREVRVDATRDLPRIHSDGRSALLIDVGEESTKLRVWDFISRKSKVEFSIPIDAVTAMHAVFSCSEDGSKYIAGYRRTLSLLDVKSGAVSTSIEIPGDAGEVEMSAILSHDGSKLAAILNDGGDRLVIWETATGTQLGSLEARPLPAGAEDIRQKLAEEAPRSVPADEQARQRLEERRKHLRRVTSKGREPLGIGGFSPDGKLLAVGRWREVVVVDVSTAKVRETIAVGAAMDRHWRAALDKLAPEPLGPKPKENAEQAIHDDFSSSPMVFSPDGRTLAVESANLVAVVALTSSGAKPGKGVK